jgi:hypothetical protein
MFVSVQIINPVQADSDRRGYRLLVLRKAVIPAAGLGTRLLSVTKEQPEEMLPVFARAKNLLSV